jgi:hypothetical protein
MNLPKIILLITTLIISFIASSQEEYVDSFCKAHYKDSDRVKNARYWTVEENDYMAICYIGKQFDNKYTLIIKDNKKGWNVKDQMGNDNGLAYLRNTLIAYRYLRKEWGDSGLPTTTTCKALSEDLISKDSNLTIHKYLYDSYNVSQLGNSDKYIKSQLNCLIEFVQPTLNGGKTYKTLSIKYNKNNGAYEYERDKRHEAGGTAYPVEKYIKKIIEDRKSKNLF